MEHSETYERNLVKERLNMRRSQILSLCNAVSHLADIADYHELTRCKYYLEQAALALQGKDDADTDD